METRLGKPREMVGFFARLTPEQKKRALEYRGPDYHGDPAEGATGEKELWKPGGFPRICAL